MKVVTFEVVKDAKNEDIKPHQHTELLKLNVIFSNILTTLNITNLCKLKLLISLKNEIYLSLLSFFGKR